MQQLYVVYDREKSPLAISGSIEQLGVKLPVRVIWADTPEQAHNYQERNHPAGEVIDARVAPIEDVQRLFFLQQFQLLAMSQQPQVPPGFDPKGRQGKRR